MKRDWWEVLWDYERRRYDPFAWRVEQERRKSEQRQQTKPPVNRGFFVTQKSKATVE